jgi:radical SAM superfamily enzyme YgiQ (UPF0313 family)
MRKANIRPLPSYVIGWPGESSETIDETFAHIKRSRYETPVIFVGIRIFPNTKIARIAKDEGLIKTDTDLLYPVFYQPERALQEFAPIVRRKIKLLSDANCLYPTRGVNFLNQLIQNVYLRGGFTSSGYTDFIDRLNNLSWKEKMGLFTKTALDFALPFRRRFIPIAESDK